MLVQDLTLSETETWWIRDWDSSPFYWTVSNKNISETETWWIRDWDTNTIATHIKKFNASETETWWIRDWDLRSADYQRVPPRSETETWWIRDWDWHILFSSLSDFPIWNWDLMNKGLRPFVWATFIHNIIRIWNWDLMNKGLRPFR